MMSPSLVLQNGFTIMAYLSFEPHTFKPWLREFGILIASSDHCTSPSCSKLSACEVATFQSAQVRLIILEVRSVTAVAQSVCAARNFNLYRSTRGSGRDTLIYLGPRVSAACSRIRNLSRFGSTVTEDGRSLARLRGKAKYVNLIPCRGRVTLDSLRVRARSAERRQRVTLSPAET